MERILVNTDFSSQSKTAIRYAVNFAMSRKAVLVIVCVFHSSQEAHGTAMLITAISGSRTMTIAPLKKIPSFLSIMYLMKRYVRIDL